MDLPDIKHLSPADQLLVTEAFQKLLNEKQTGNGIISLESFADILDKVGLHEEARKYFREISASTNDILTRARCWRKIAFSSNSQRDYMSADVAADNATILIHHLPMSEKPVKEEYVMILHNAAHSYYFQLKFEKLEAAVREIKRFLPDISDIALRFNLLHAVSMAMYTKYRWYLFPEEAFTHIELQLQLTAQLEDKFHLGYTHCIGGHFRMFNEEFEMAREHFSKGIQELEGKHFGPLMIAYNYTAVSYRMQNNVSMAEQWTQLTLEKARQTTNVSYVPSSYANLAWVSAKRKNWLYAEDYARKAAENWPIKALHCYYAFPLMECLLQKREMEEAGYLAFKLVHPRVKKLPDILTGKLHAAVKAWVNKKKNEFFTYLQDAIDEAKLTGYY